MVKWILNFVGEYFWFILAVGSLFQVIFASTEEGRILGAIAMWGALHMSIGKLILNNFKEEVQLQDKLIDIITALIVKNTKKEEGE